MPFNRKEVRQFLVDNEVVIDRHESPYRLLAHVAGLAGILMEPDIDRLSEEMGVPEHKLNNTVRRILDQYMNGEPLRVPDYMHAPMVNGYYLVARNSGFHRFWQNNGAPLPPQRGDCFVFSEADIQKFSNSFDGR